MQRISELLSRKAAIACAFSIRSLQRIRRFLAKFNFNTLMDHGFRKVLCLALDGKHVYPPGPGFGIVEVWSIRVWRELSFQIQVG